MILAVTGHRPDKIHVGVLHPYSQEHHLKLVKFAKACIAQQNPDEVVTGMALGWDIAVACACIELGVRFKAAVPFAGQDSKWFHQSQVLYQHCLTLAAEIQIVSAGGYAPWKMQKRNEVMVDQSDKVLALWNGDQSGGTYNCVAYARAQNKQLLQCWNAWAKFRA